MFSFAADSVMSEEAASTPTTTSPAAVNIKVEEGEDMFEGLFLFYFHFNVLPKRGHNL